MPFVHSSCQPGPSGNRQLHAHSTLPAASLARRATASCTPIVHPPSWPIGQPPAARPLCTRPAASLAHRATASCTPIVHPPSCQPGPSGNRQLHAHSAPAQLPAWPIRQPPAARPAHTQLHRELSRSSWAALQCTRQHPPSPAPSNLWLISPLPPTSQMKTKPGCQCLNVCLINCELLLIVGTISV